MMTSRTIQAIAVVVFLAVMIGVAFAHQSQQAEQNKYTLKSPNGIAFSEFKGYEDWQDVAVSRTDKDIKAILANPVMIAAYKSGIPGNGKPFPDGSKVVKIEWSKTPNPVSPYAVEIPNKIDAVAFIEKDSKRFPDSSGWGYAQLNYDASTDKFSAYGNDATFGTKICYQCHTIVKTNDYIFTAYHPR
ncbi:MAG TPA: cytochrome P460 family protein [Candidatus Acidoferrales bacterium]